MAVDAVLEPGMAAAAVALVLTRVCTLYMPLWLWRSWDSPVHLELEGGEWQPEAVSL